MDKKEKSEELLSRRVFFQKSARTALPILGVSLFGTTILSACDKDDDEESVSGGGCKGNCSGSCSGDCAGNCDGCSGGCDGSACTYM